MSEQSTEINKCSCFEDTLAKVRGKIEESLPDGAIDVEVDWEGYMFFMSGDFSPVNPQIKYSYRKQKKDGSHAKGLTKDTALMIGSYCPYCGRKLGKSGGPA